MRRRSTRRSRPPQPLNIIQKTYRAEALARLQRAIIADCGVTERLVAFWSNHFCISATRANWRGCGRLVRARGDPAPCARPLADMLKAVEQHPAMLFFLDNSNRSARIPAPGRTASAG